MSKEIGEFSLTATTFTVGDDTFSANWEGTATGFGNVVGTLTARGETGAEFGTCSWRSASFLDDGTQLEAVGEGTWKSIGKHRFQLRFTHLISDGSTLLADGVADMATRTFTGKLFD